MNRFPLWKYLLVLAVVVFGVLAALPNFYGSAPALQVVGDDGEVLDSDDLARVSQLLVQSQSSASDACVRDGRLFFTFDDIDTQSAALDAFLELDPEGLLAAKTLAPLQPSWLRALGLAPMSLGLDLRGGV